MVLGASVLLELHPVSIGASSAVHPCSQYLLIAWELLKRSTQRFIFPMDSFMSVATVTHRGNATSCQGLPRTFCFVGFKCKVDGLQKANIKARFRRTCRT